MINGLDLFSGIGGLSIALEEWVRPIAYCENDPYAQAVLLSRMWSGELQVSPIWDDVRTLDRHAICENPDIIFGGFPCQDISVAGHGIGLEGKRSGLYWEMHRLIKEFKPSFVFFENVPAIRTRGAREVVTSLAALGYTSNWDVVSAREVGASFLGERWFLLAAADSETLRLKQRRLWGENWSKSSAFNSSACDERTAPWTSESGFESRIFGNGNGIPFAVDRDRCLGNSVVYLQAKKAFRKLLIGEFL